MLINPDCCRDILIGIQSEFSESPRKPYIKMRHVLDSDVLGEYGQEEISIAYNMLLDKHLIVLYLSPAVPAGKHTARIPADTEKTVRQSKIKHHHIARITTAGYTLLDASINVPFWTKIKAQKLFDNVCAFVTAGKTLAEIIAALS